jgi:hypothetical protein
MTHAIVSDLVSRLDANLRDTFEERAAIMEFDGGLQRDLAEALALLNVLSTHPLALAGISAWQIELDGESLLALITDDGRAREHLADIRAGLLSTKADLATAVQTLGGIACLVHLG